MTSSMNVWLWLHERHFSCCVTRSAGSRSMAGHECSKISATKMFLHFETIITIGPCRPGGSPGLAEAVPQSLRPYEFLALSLLLLRDLLYLLNTTTKEKTPLYTCTVVDVGCNDGFSYFKIVWSSEKSKLVLRISKPLYLGTSRLLRVGLPAFGW